MSWITVAKAGEITGQTVTQAALDQATSRLEALPFTDDVLTADDGTWEPRAHGRFVDGFVPDGDGKAIPGQPIPLPLAVAVATLARYYTRKPLAFETDAVLTGNVIEEGTPSLLADLPNVVVTSVWPYLHHEIKGVDVEEPVPVDERERARSIPLSYR